MGGPSGSRIILQIVMPVLKPTFYHHHLDVPDRPGRHVGAADSAGEFPDDQPHDHYICQIQLLQRGCGISGGSSGHCHDDSAGGVQQD